MHKVTNVFTEEELKAIHEAIENAEYKAIDTGGTPLGRLNVHGFQTPDSVVERIEALVDSFSEVKLSSYGGCSCVIYSNEYGEPTLPPHYDGDDNDLIIDYQLSSNTTWGIGVNLEVYELEDNSAIMFNPNTNIHWRPIKKFEDGEYVIMLFFRFFNEKNRSDYSHLPMHPNDEAFKEVRKLRDSLNS